MISQGHIDKTVVQTHPAPRAIAMVCVCEPATGFWQASEVSFGLHVVSESLAVSVRVTDCITVEAAAPALPSKPRSCICRQCWLASDTRASFMLTDPYAPGQRHGHVQSRDVRRRGRCAMDWLAQGREPSEQYRSQDGKRVFVVVETEVSVGVSGEGWCCRRRGLDSSKE